MSDENKQDLSCVVGPSARYEGELGAKLVDNKTGKPIAKTEALSKGIFDDMARGAVRLASGKPQPPSLEGELVGDTRVERKLEVDGRKLRQTNDPLEVENGFKVQFNNDLFKENMCDVTLPSGEHYKAPVVKQAPVPSAPKR